jgi:GGDEF domain-containing protein
VPPRRSLRRRPARAAPGLPAAGLVERADELAKAWLVELVDQAPLDATPPGGPLFAAQAPALCAAVVRALVSDDELARLEPGGDLNELAALAGALGGAAGAAGAVTAVEALRAVTWAAIEDALPRDDADLPAVAERLSITAAVVAAAAAAATAGEAQPAAVRPAGVGSRGAAEAPAAAPADPRVDPDHPGWARVPPPRVPGAEPRIARLTPVEDPVSVTTDDLETWGAALERGLAAGGTFSVLLLELERPELLAATEGEEEAAQLVRRALGAARAALRPEDVSHAEDIGRLWVLAPATGRLSAGSLAENAAVAVERAVTVRGAPLTAAVGLAVHPADGTDAETLVGRAEERLFGARAAGERVGGMDPGEESLGAGRDG